MKHYDLELYAEILKYYEQRTDLQTKIRKSVKMDKNTHQSNANHVTHT